MADNKIIIGSGKVNKTTRDRLAANEKADDSLKKERDLHQENEQPPDDGEDIHIWGNDSDIDKKLDPQYLAEKRRYMRVRYIQRIECKSISSSADAEPEVLKTPIVFTTCDISMGGIGAVCDDRVAEETILNFTVTIDQMSYDIQCRVVFCIENDDKYRIGLKLLRKDKDFIKHLKIFVARISLQSRYGSNGG